VRPIAEQTILVTGATDGLGRQVALDLAEQGATLILHGRDHPLGAEVLADVHRAAGHERSIGQQAIDFDDVMPERSYEQFGAYSQSKLAQILFTFELSERVGADSGVTVNALHPATLMDTTMVRESFGRSRTTVEEGARATERLIVDPDLDAVTGRYYDGLEESTADPQAYDTDSRRRLWTLSEELTGARFEL